jgi:O-6-methylguanine DNA methyltransferase
MSCEQLEEAVELAKRIAGGKEDLVALDLQSLEVRGKTSKKNRMEQPAYRTNDREENILNTSENLVSEKVKTKRKNAEQDGVDAAVRPFKKTKTSDKQSVFSFVPASNQAGRHLLLSTSASIDQKMDLSPMLRKIESHPALTRYRKHLYACLLSVPIGRYTTYAALSDFLNSSARAVGNGMRNNPFAPEVPCHRVLASDGSIGGFGGSWGIDGENASKKFDLLKEEGVKFDSRGKARGPPFRNFVDLLDDN